MLFPGKTYYKCNVEKLNSNFLDTNLHSGRDIVEHFGDETKRTSIVGDLSIEYDRGVFVQDSDGLKMNLLVDEHQVERLHGMASDSKGVNAEIVFLRSGGIIDGGGTISFLKTDDFEDYLLADLAGDSKEGWSSCKTIC